MKTKELIEEIMSLPVEDRVLVADSVLRSLNTPETGIDKKWTKETRKRLEDLRYGKIKAIPGDEVFDKINKRFND
ncbi:addiction module protein [Aliifodinibius sp. S!AR15-10]|uniref:addiction module protein n=1 Tax=Aliifodinibius sp. S!AR15-10 TaxID=2950437 RepID=UPI002858B417|nr:addiction module protein [Aliifodinibius sp. S!AR15-10]MDR8389497.1 addiction module protein [Aliifodinibius sp. S!AR15-10]